MFEKVSVISIIVLFIILVISFFIVAIVDNLKELKKGGD